MPIHIQLKQFDGPLDLLLHLIGRAKIDIKDIFVSEITEQFIEAVSNATDFDMDEASEFITMAALLVEIKSRSLLPRPPAEEEEDPEQQLIDRLTAYKQIKESAVEMTEFEKSARQVFGKLPEEVPLPPPELEIDGLTLEMLWDALLRIAERKPGEKEEAEYVPRDIQRDHYSVDQCITNIRARLKKGPVPFDELFSHKPSRQEAVTLFIALLELLKRGKTHVTQSKPSIESSCIPEGGSVVEIREACRAIEAILFVSGDAVDIKDIAQALEMTEMEASTAVDALKRDLDDGKRGIKLSRYGDHMKLETREDYAPYVERLLQPVQRQTLSQSAMETLAVVAYRQPVTRLDVEEIRGVKCDYSIQSLLHKGLIQNVGRKESLGRPYLYATTDFFLEHFGIADIRELPPLPNMNPLQEEEPLIP